MPADFSCCFFDDFPMSEKNIGYPKKLNNIIAAPKITNTIPVAWFKVLGSALLAKRAAILAQIKDGKVGNRSGQRCKGHNKYACANRRF